jgi:hypothetical protein
MAIQACACEGGLICKACVAEIAFTIEYRLPCIVFLSRVDLNLIEYRRAGE